MNTMVIVVAVLISSLIILFWGALAYIIGKHVGANNYELRELENQKILNEYENKKKEKEKMLAGSKTKKSNSKDYYANTQKDTQLKNGQVPSNPLDSGLRLSESVEQIKKATYNQADK